MVELARECKPPALGVAYSLCHFLSTLCDKDKLTIDSNSSSLSLHVVVVGWANGRWAWRWAWQESFLLAMDSLTPS